MLTSIVGINWGDEGKGRMVDLLAASQDIVVRYQGGNNAGHTVINEKGKFVLNLLPSAILREDKVNVMGNGMVVNIEHLVKEIAHLREGGIDITPDRLKISDKAVVCCPFDVMQDGLEEDRLADRKFGSTRRGIAPVYADKYMKKAIRMGDLLHPQYLRERLETIVDWKNLMLKGMYDFDGYTVDELVAWFDTYGKPLIPYICDVSTYLDNALTEGKNVMLEAQLGALRDIDFGIYPYTTSSSTITAYGPVGAGIPWRKVDTAVGVMKAYSTCVGEGPFTAEMFGEEGENLRKAGGEYGAATGRPRRVGGFDVVASRYGVKMQGATEIALTKLDVLDGFTKIPVCVAYEVDGVRVDNFPSGEALNKAKPVIEYLDGWQTSTADCRKYEDLPQNARKYIEFLEKSVGCYIKYISVGAERDAIIVK